MKKTKEILFIFLIAIILSVTEIFINFGGIFS